MRAPAGLDLIDAKILELLQNDASLSVAEVAEQVGLSSSPCWRRIKRLEERGVIARRVTILDRATLGLDFEVVAAVKLTLPTSENLAAFEDAVTNMPEVLECALITGGEDYTLRIVTADMHAYDRLLREEILSLGLVADVRSRIVVRTVKSTTAAPLSRVLPELDSVNAPASRLEESNAGEGEHDQKRRRHG